MANALISDELGAISPIKLRFFFKLPKTFTIYDAAGEQISGGKEMVASCHALRFN